MSRRHVYCILKYNFVKRNEKTKDQAFRFRILIKIGTLVIAKKSV
jgi:hypothetical protein